MQYFDFDSVIGSDRIFQWIIEYVFNKNVNSFRPKNLYFHTVFDHRWFSVSHFFFPEFGETQRQGYSEEI
jgi:hypothetical protein